ncbi:MAG: hypothetical protein SP1CHLAM54_04810 [Chlamydiia bacterium]|nr:hypothetical protein [Chlamydiia bacterium]MCH9615393.1 hypothetical protein [Chlamydiia bacterium]MCH9628285.1 hypothetical protein [Chlamydiia bacterium]
MAKAACRTDYTGDTNAYPPFGSRVTWKPESTGLYLFVSGLSANPDVWEVPLRAVQERDKTADVIAPHIYRNGDASLDDTSTSVIRLVEEYIRAHPDNKVCLIGESNGARIVARIEHHLRSRPTRVKVITLAGAFFGTTKLTRLNQTGCTKCCFSPELRRGLEAGSAESLALLQSMQEAFPAPPPEREFDFYASKDDTHLSPWQGALPAAGKGETYHTATNTSHVEMIERFGAQVVDNATTWMQRP